MTSPQAETPPDVQSALGRRPIRMVALDMDGTLLPSGGLGVSSANRRVLHMAVQAGVEVVIATGRRHAFASPVIEPLGLAPATVMITSNGTVTRSLGGESFSRRTLPVETAIGLCEPLRQAGTAVFTFDREGPGEMVVENLDLLSVHIEGWVRANRAFIREFKPLEAAFVSGEAPVQGMVAGSVREMDNVQEMLIRNSWDKAVEMHRTEYPRRDLTILDILPLGVSKASALEELCASRGISAANVMAVGDNWNDNEMLNFAGWPVLMANAAPDLLEAGKALGWQVTGSNDEDGVATAILRALAVNAAVKPV